MSKKYDQRVVAVRIPKLTYKLLEERSLRDDMSISSLIRTILIGFFRTDTIELDKIRHYGSKKSKQLAMNIEVK